LLKRRGVLVQTRQDLQQSLGGLKVPAKSLFRELARVIERVELRLQTLIRELGWWLDYQRCLSIPGIGPVNAAALTAAYHRGEFANADAFIAFLGPRRSATRVRHLQGQTEADEAGRIGAATTAHCAARPARSLSRFETYYQQQLDKGLSKTAANVILARKLARIAFSLIRNRQTFEKSYGLKP